MYSTVFRNNKFSRPMLIMICISSIAGCAAAEKAREVARITATSTNELKNETTKFFQEANEFARKNESRLQELNQLTLANRIQVGVASSAWAIAEDERASTMFTGMTKIGSNEVGVQSVSLTLFQPASFTLKNSFDPAQYDDLVKRLNKLAEESNFVDNVLAYTNFGKTIYGQLNKDREDAKKKLKDINGDSDKKLKSLIIN